MTLLTPNRQGSNNQSKIPLRLVLVVPFLLQIFGAVGLVGYFSFINGQQAVNELASQLMGEVSDRVEQNLKVYLATSHRINQTNLNAVNLGLLNMRDLQPWEKYLWQQVQLFPHITFILVANEKGEQRTGEKLADGSLRINVVGEQTGYNFHSYKTNANGERTTLLTTIKNYDPRSQNWYNALQAGKPIWSEVDVSFLEPTLLISALQPVYPQKEGQLRGVLKTALRLDRIGYFLNGLEIGKSGQAFIIDRKGTLLATSTDEKPFRITNNTKYLLKATDSSQPLTEATARYIATHLGSLDQIKRSWQTKFTFKNKRHFLQVLPFLDRQGLDWLVVVVVPESDFMDTINANTRTTILLCLGALVLATVLGIFTSQWIAKPILRLRDASLAIANGNFDQTIAINSIEELSVLGVAFNQMGQQLKQSRAQLEDYARSLEQKVEERTQALQQEIRDKEAAERHRTTAQEALRVSEERWQLALRGTNDGIWDCDLATQKIFYSPRCKQMLGYEDREIGNNLDEFNSRIHPDDVEQTRQAVQDHLAGKTPFYAVEIRIRSKDGTYKWMLSRAQAVRDETGKPIRLVGAITDISDRRQREEALQSIVKGTASAIGSEFFHCLVQHLAKVLQVRCALVAECADREKTRARTLAVWAGEGLGENFEYNLAGTPCAYVMNQQRCFYLENVQTLFPGDRYLVDFNIQGYWGIPLQNSAGDSIGVLAVLDVKPMRYSQTQESILKIFAARAGAELERKHIEEQLRAAKDAADSANRAKSEFLANMSHELRTPLNGILGYAQILSKGNPLNPQQRQGISTIYQCGSHLLTLINDILDLSKIEARKMELHPGSFHFPSFLQGLVEICRIKAEQKGILLNYQSTSSLPEGIFADEKRLRQVLINLLSNAIKFTDTGSVTFQVEVISHQSSVNSQGLMTNDQGLMTNTKLRFHIEDTGVGMSSEQLERIFLPFEQVGSVTKQIEGTGLGLTISQNIISMMGGTINVKSQPGVGSIFWVDLDLPEATDWVKAARTSEQGAIAGIKGKTPQILVVDDKWENRSVLTSLLKLVGFEVVEATNGREGLEKAAAFRPDAIITDLAMPEMDGFEMMQRIRASPDLKDVVIIVSSASAFEIDRQSSLLAGGDDFLPKPVQAIELFNLLQNYLKLTWIYSCEDERGEEQDKNLSLDALTSQNYPEKIVAPPSENLTVLWDLAKKGRVTNLQEEAERIERLDKKFVPFSRQLVQLAREFKIKEIREFIKQYLEERNE
jgi:PAS domain S-box-containing protein